MLAIMPLVAGGCHWSARDSRDIAINASITPQPVHTGTETILFRLTDQAEQPVGGALVQVEGDMNHPGMAPVFADAAETATGTYRAQLNFSMGGDWVVLFHIKLSDGRKAERQITVQGVKSN